MSTGRGSFRLSTSRFIELPADQGAALCLVAVHSVGLRLARPRPFGMHLLGMYRLFVSRPNPVGVVVPTVCDIERLGLAACTVESHDPEPVIRIVGIST